MAPSVPTPMATRAAPKGPPTPKGPKGRRIYRKRGSKIWRRPTNMKKHGIDGVISPGQKQYYDGLKQSARVRNSIMSQGLKFKSEAARDAYLRGKPDLQVLMDRCSSTKAAFEYLQEMGILNAAPKYLY